MSSPEDPIYFQWKKKLISSKMLSKVIYLHCQIVEIVIVNKDTSIYKFRVQSAAKLPIKKCVDNLSSTENTLDTIC